MMTKTTVCIDLSSDSAEEDAWDTPSAPIIWKKGDHCQAPYGDEWYNAVITKIRRDKKGVPHAVIKYLDYPDEEEEDVLCSALKAVAKRKRHQVSKTDTAQKQEDASDEGGMFSPLRAHEEDMRLSEKFRVLEEEEERENETRKKRSAEKSKNHLQKALAESIASPSPSPGRMRKKALLVMGGSEKKSSSTQRTRNTSANNAKEKTLHTSVTSSDDDSSLSTHLGQDKKAQEIKREVKLSTPNSGERRTRIHTGLTSESDSDDGEVGKKPWAGFDDEDMEKPYFSRVQGGPKVPLLLSKDGEEPAVQVPATLNRYLRDYQRNGVRFLYKHYRNNHGALLADDMGLGKTVQVIAFIAAVLGKTGTRPDVMQLKPHFIRKLSDSTYDEGDRKKKPPFLIIGPASVLYNWADELETWGHFCVGKYHRQFKEGTIADLQKEKLEVVITTFETCRDHVDDLNKFKWSAVFADEAHKIKGLKAEVSQALRRLKCRRRYGLTGTPLQNRVEELWCLLDWANPGCLGGTIDFHWNVVKKIEKGQKQDATKRELADARKAQERLAAERDKWMLRRTKVIISDQMPKKSELVVFCKPTELQLDIYRTILAQEDMNLILKQNHPCDCGSRYTRGRCCYKVNRAGQKIRALTFTYMHLLLKAANHIALLLPNKTPSEIQQAYSTKVCKQVFEHHPEFVQQTAEASFRTLSNPKFCGKMKVLQGLISVFKKQHAKVLLFSYSTQLLNIIEPHIISLGHEYRRLDGTTPEAKRVQLVREFNNDPNIFIFLVSTRAGGVGLNLTGANVVVIFDPNWNPTHDLQAQDRAYRIGQRRDIRVLRLVCSGTIEENVYLRQVYKQQLDSAAVSTENAKRLFQGVQGSKRHKGELFGTENMFHLRTGNRCLTEDIIKRNDKIEAGLQAFNVAPYVALSLESGEEKEDENEDIIDSTDSGSDEYEEEDILNKKEVLLQQRKNLENIDQHNIEFISSLFGLDSSDCDTPTRPSQKSPVKARRVPMGLMDSPAKDSSNIKTPKQKSNIPTRKHTKRHICTESESESDNDIQPRTRHTTTGLCKCRTCRDPKPSTSGYNPSRQTHKLDWSDSDSDSVSPIKTNSAVRKNKKEEKKSPKSRKRKSVKFEDSDSDEQKEDKPKKAIPQTLQSFGSISDVFENCGVVHTHRNKQVIGTSKAENHMSRCAMQDVVEHNQYSQMPAVNCELFEASPEETDEETPPKKASRRKKTAPKKEKIGSQKTGRGRKKTEPDPNAPRMVSVGSKKVLVGQTPKAIGRQQFESLAKHLSTSTLALAQKVMDSTDDQVTEMLREFYTSQDPEMDVVFPQAKAASDDEEDEKEVSERPAKKKRSTPLQSTARKRRVHTNIPKGCQYDNASSDSDTEVSASSPEKRYTRGSTQKQSSLVVDKKMDNEHKTMDKGRKSPDKYPISTKRRLDASSNESFQLASSRGLEENENTAKSHPCRRGDIDSEGLNTLDEIFGDFTSPSLPSPSVATQKSPCKNVRKMNHDDLSFLSSGETPGFCVTQKYALKNKTEKVQQSPQAEQRKRKSCEGSDELSFLDDIFFDDIIRTSPPRAKKIGNAKISEKSKKKLNASQASDEEQTSKKSSRIYVEKSSRISAEKSRRISVEKNPPKQKTPDTGSYDPEYLLDIL